VLNIKVIFKFLIDELKALSEECITLSLTLDKKAVILKNETGED
jgi:DNA polymerase III sliding clamp (beta) subunit (PCNA family)